jgi:tetratricopeptide (TPR) repeat protein
MIGLYMKGWILIPFILLLAIVFADTNLLANGVVSAKYFWFYASMALMIPVIPFLKLVRLNVSDFFVLLVGSGILIVALISGAPFAKTKLVLLLLLLVLYFLIRRVLDTSRPAEKLFAFVLIGTALVESIIGLRQLYGYIPSNHGLFKITGTFFNPGPYSGYIGMIFPLALFYTLPFLKTEYRYRSLINWQLKKIINQIKEGGFSINLFFEAKTFWMTYLFGALSFATVLASMLVLPAAMSRASWIGLVTGSVWVFMCYDPVRNLFRKLLNTKFRRFWTATVLCLFFLSAGIGLYALKPASVDGRLLLWKNALKTMADHPLGVGLGKFGSAVGETQAAFFASDKGTQAEIDRADVPFYAFNEFLQIGVESGVFLLALFFGMLFLTLKKAYKKGRHGLIGAILSLMLFACFSYPFSVLPFLVVLVFLLAMSNDGTTGESPAKTSATGWGQFHNRTHVLINLLYVFLIVAGLADRFPTYYAWKEWSSCKIVLNVKLYKDAARDLKPLYPLLNDNTEYLFDYARALTQAGFYRESNQVLLQSMSFNADPMLYNVYGKNCQVLNNFSEAECAFKKAYDLVPNRIYPLYLLAKLYTQVGNPESARRISDKVFNHKVLVPSRAIEEMKDSLRLINNM